MAYKGLYAVVVVLISIGRSIFNNLSKKKDNAFLSWFKDTWTQWHTDLIADDGHKFRILSRHRVTNEFNDGRRPAVRHATKDGRKSPTTTTKNLPEDDDDDDESKVTHVEAAIGSSVIGRRVRDVRCEAMGWLARAWVAPPLRIGCTRVLGPGRPSSYVKWRTAVESWRLGAQINGKWVSLQLYTILRTCNVYKVVNEKTRRRQRYGFSRSACFLRQWKEGLVLSISIRIGPLSLHESKETSKGSSSFHRGTHFNKQMRVDNLIISSLPHTHTHARTQDEGDDVFVERMASCEVRKVKWPFSTGDQTLKMWLQHPNFF